MHDSPKITERSGRSGGLAVALVMLLLALLPALYVLSIGPADYLINANNGAGAETARVIYFPLIWLHQNSEWARDILDWYMQFWQ